MQYTIETRQLTNAMTQHPHDGPRQTVVEASNAGEAISKFIEEDACELVSFTAAGSGRESIATVRKEDSVFLVRVYPE